MPGEYIPQPIKGGTGLGTPSLAGGQQSALSWGMPALPSRVHRWQRSISKLVGAAWTKTVQLDGIDQDVVSDPRSWPASRFRMGLSLAMAAG